MSQCFVCYFLIVFLPLVCPIELCHVVLQYYFETVTHEPNLARIGSQWREVGRGLFMCIPGYPGGVKVWGFISYHLDRSAHDLLKDIAFSEVTAYSFSLVPCVNIAAAVLYDLYRPVHILCITVQPIMQQCPLEHK